MIGLELGADDYVVKPFSAREVAGPRPGRAAASEPRQRAEPTRGALEVGELRLDPARPPVTLGGETIELTRKEFELLELLMRNAGVVVTRERLLDEVWDAELVRLDEDARRARRARCGASSATTPPRPAASTPCAASGSASPPPGTWTACAASASAGRGVRLRAAAARAWRSWCRSRLNLTRRIDAEVEAEAASQAQLIAASASGRLATGGSSTRLVRRARTARSRAGDRDRRARPRCSRTRRAAAWPRPRTASRPEVARALDRPARAGRAPQRLAQRGPALHRRAGGAGRPARGRGAGHPERGGGQRPQAP